jgi:tetratricopeptide (TPR) repeat protein
MNPDFLGNSNRVMAERAYITGDYGSSEELFRQAVEEAESRDPHSVELAICLMGLAQVYGSQWQYDRCEKHLLRALSIVQAGLRQDDPQVIRCLKEIGLMYQVQSKYPEAEAYYRYVMEILAVEPEPRRELAEVVAALVDMFKDQGRYPEAEAAQRRLIQMTEKLMGADHPDLAQQMIDLAEIYDENAKYDKAADWLRLAVQITRKARGPNHPQSAAFLKKLINIQEKDRRQREISGTDVSWQG